MILSIIDEFQTTKGFESLNQTFRENVCTSVGSKLTLDLDLLMVMLYFLLKVTTTFAEHVSGQILATSHDLTPNGGLVREILLFQGNLGW